jgi:hypothetical protein
MTLLIGVISLSVALYIGDVSGEGLFRNMIKLFSVATAPIAIPMIMGLLSGRASSTDAMIGFLVGITTGLLLLLFGKDEVHALGAVWKKENIILLGTTITTLSAMLITRTLTEARPEESTRTREFMDRLRQPIGTLDQDLPVQPGHAAISPLRIVGLCVSLLGGLMLVALPWLEDQSAFRMDLYIAVALLLIGILMMITDKRTKTSQEE